MDDQSPKMLKYQQRISWLLFIVLFSYVILRAFLVNPLLDEVGSLYWYIQTGFLPGHGAVMDANNHILNSVVSHWFYEVLGDHLIVIRLFSVVSFPLYFWSIIGIVKQVTTSKHNIFLGLSIVSIPWILEYFAYSRGYGISLAFLFFAIYSLKKNDLHYSGWNQWAFILTMILALSANLNLFLTILLLFASQLILSFVRKDRFHQWTWWLSNILFVLFSIPAVIYMRKLEKVGALWWGSESGYVETTLGSLNRVIFFNDQIWIGGLVLLIYIITVVIYYRHPVNWNFINLLLPALFFGNIIGSLLMNKLLKIHFPSDRMVMHLIPLLLLCIVIVWNLKITKRLFYPVYAWCLVSLGITINLSTSIYSPEDRLSKYIESFIDTNNSKGISLSGDYVICQLYAYSQRNKPVKQLIMEYNGSNNQTGYYHLSWQNTQAPNNFKLIGKDPVTNMKVWQCNKPKVLIPFKSWRNVNAYTNDTLILGSVTGMDSNTQMKVHFKGKIQCLEQNHNYAIQLLRKDKRGYECIATTRLNSYCGTELVNYIEGDFKIVNEDNNLEKWLIVLVSAQGKRVFWNGNLTLHYLTKVI